MDHYESLKENGQTIGCLLGNNTKLYQGCKNQCEKSAYARGIYWLNIRMPYFITEHETTSK